NDTLRGGVYGDTYRFNLGDGHDVITDITNSNSTSYRDILQFGGTADFDEEDLWFSREGDDLQITIAGTNDQITVNDWYTSSNNQIEEISIGSSVLFNTKVEQLVSAMASYDVPNGEGNVIPQDVKEELQPVIANTWQAA
ncbi:calcium-binding protein, partial [Methylophaga sp. OBS4]|uniref:calcium-binding protein n=1 Tax=Methylophaga sp. OBS4 TaxID=2991935 RepID=UPI0022574FAA